MKYKYTAPDNTYNEIQKNIISYNEIQKTIIWFQSIFKEIMNEENWCIVNFWNIDHMAFVIADKTNTIPYENYTHITNYYKSNPELIQLTRQYGWLVSDNGIITGYDLNNLTRNKHLLTANELNLL